MRYIGFILLLIAMAGYASEKDREWNQSAFGERAVYQLESQFSYVSVWGVTDLHDIVTTANGGTVSLNAGFLEVQSGTSANATADIETVDRVIYESGRAIEASIKIGVKDAPTGGSIAEWGVGSDNNGAYYRLDDGTFSVVYEDAGTEVETIRANFRGDAASCDDFDPTQDGSIYTIRFNWYGAGGASYYVYYPSDDEKDTLSKCLLHWEAPDSDGGSWDNPNLPIFARVDNKSSGDDVVLTVGGRRAGTQGKVTQNFRPAGEFRTGQSVAAAAGLVPLICVRRDSSFPTASSLNAIRVLTDGFGIETDQDAFIYFVVNPTLTGASFGTATNAVAGETGLQWDKSATALSSASHVSGPYLISGGQGNQSSVTDMSQDTMVPFIADNPTCLAADVQVDAVVTSTWRVREGW